MSKNFMKDSKILKFTYSIQKLGLIINLRKFCKKNNVLKMETTFLTWLSRDKMCPKLYLLWTSIIQKPSMALLHSTQSVSDGKPKRSSLIFKGDFFNIQDFD